MLKKAVRSFAAVLLAFLPLTSHAASFSLNPNGGSTVEEDIFVTVGISSPNEQINAFSGVISTNLSSGAQIVSVSPSPSADYWTQPPVYAESEGRIYLEAVLFNPGFQGDYLPVATIHVQGVSGENAGFSFESGAILANDGRGSNILQNLPAASYTFVSSVTSPSVEESVPESTLALEEEVEFVEVDVQEIDAPVEEEGVDMGTSDFFVSSGASNGEQTNTMISFYLWMLYLSIGFNLVILIAFLVHLQFDKKHKK